MIRYRAFGLIVESAIALPGGGAIERSDSPPDVSIVVGTATPPDPEAELGPYSRSGDHLCFTAEGVARYLIVGAAHIVIEPFPDADDTHVAALLIATALPALLWARGHYALHACAVVPAGRTTAVAITAPSGSGKSTLLAECLSRGATMLADDVVCLSGEAPRAVASGLPGGYFLGHASPAERSFHPVLPSKQMVCAPLGMLVHIDRTGTGPAGIERLRAAVALETLLAARHRPRVPRLIADPAAHLARSALLARTLAIYRLTTGGETPAATFDRLTALLEGLPEEPTP